MTVYIQKENVEHRTLVNDTGSDIEQYEFAVIEPFAGIADEDIASAASGSFAVAENLEVQTDDLATSEDTFATLGQPVYFDPATSTFSDTYNATYYLVGYLVTVKDSNGVIVFEKQRYAVLDGDKNELAGEPFRKTVTLTAAAAATPVNILTAAEVGAGRKAYVDVMIAKVNGATAWTDATATIVKIQDTADTPIVGVTMAKAQLTGNAVLGLLSTGVTLAAPVSTGVGFTAAKGLDIVADAIFGAGSDLVVTVTGYIE